eukprot:PhM_4_TR15931/c3_g1_i6/m.189
MMTVRLAGRHSQNFNQASGVPQGSVLAPMLWNFYVDTLLTSLDLTFAQPDLTSHHIDGKVWAFADDVSVALRAQIEQGHIAVPSDTAHHSCSAESVNGVLSMKFRCQASTSPSPL